MSNITGYKQVLESWKKMMTRCYNKTSKDYKNYGERGITVAKYWHNSTTFLNDMKPSWNLGLTLNRIDNNKGYSRENCNWATRLEQNNNTRRNRYITYRGITKTLMQWSRIFNINRRTLAYRINNGWSVEQALTRKVGY